MVADQASGKIDVELGSLQERAEAATLRSVGSNLSVGSEVEIGLREAK